MIVDSLRLDNGTALSAQVVIVGGGVAGITMALELGGRGIETLLLESGGHKPDDATRDLYRGESTEIPYQFADGCRSRFLGGSSNCWGGWCRPFDGWDFQKRDWVANSGWPIAAADLAPYYRLTHRYLELGPYDYDIDAVVRTIGRPNVRRIPLPTGRVWDSVSRFSPPTRMGKRFRAELERSRQVRVMLHANVVEIETDSAARDVTRLQIRTLSGKAFTATGRVFVLATGGIENARLLLASNRVRPRGLGNDHDVVGRYYMDHPRLYSGSIAFLGDWSRNLLFDVKYHFHNRAVTAIKTPIAAALALTREVQERERITNAKVWFSSVFPGDNTEVSEALASIKQRLQHKESPDSSLGRELFALAKHPVNTAGFIFSRIHKTRALVRDVNFVAIVEPEPDPTARVTLSPERKDALGMPRVRVGWKLSEIVRRTFDRNFAIIADELQKAGIAHVTLGEPLEGRTDWPPSLDPHGTWHHMGATRMHDSPRLGVVDRNCRVHGMSNLFVAGSSVFPTAGANYPTPTIAALAIRLSDHIAEQLKARELPLPGSSDTPRGNAVSAQAR